MGATASAISAQSHLSVQGSPLSATSPVLNTSFCPQFPPLFPDVHHNIDSNLDSLYDSKEFSLEVADRLGAIVRVPTESYDDFGPVGEDDRWKTFATLHTTLENIFPRVYESLKVVKVNTYALIFHWQGTDEELAPLLLTAHMDVVPVDPSTYDSWKHPPYSGYFDGTWVWGRGTSDDKLDIVSLLTTVESLLDANFAPKRTVVLAFGIDEESGIQGAPHIAEYLESLYGKNGFAALLDEGDTYDTPYGGNVIFASPATAEKGHLDLRIEISTPGGHSSVPPPHTAIGMLAAVIVELEDHPHEAALRRSDTFFQEVQCAAAYGPETPDNIRRLAHDALANDTALDELAQALLKWNPSAIAKLSTTQAADVISGGVKVNALPETVWALVNHRIAEHSSVQKLQDRVLSVIKPVADQYNLTLRAFGKDIVAGDAGQLVLTDVFGASFDPAPTTPTKDSPEYRILAGTIVSTLSSSAGYDGGQIVVSPALSVGNTDTRHYWNLTKNIYRYTHVPEDAHVGLHTINEAIKLDAVIGRIRFYTKFILNWDEATLD